MCHVRHTVKKPEYLGTYWARLSKGNALVQLDVNNSEIKREPLPNPAWASSIFLNFTDISRGRVRVFRSYLVPT